MNIQKKRIEYKLKSTEDLEGTLNGLKTEISFTSNLFNDCILLIGRFKDIKDAYIKDTVGRFDRNIEIAKIRGTLLEIIDKLTPEDFVTVEDAVEELIEEEGIDIEDNLGFYDFLEIAKNGFRDSTESITKLGVFTTEFNEKITEQAEKITRLNKTRNSGESKAIILKKIFKEIAGCFETYNSQVGDEISIFKDSSRKSLEAYYKAVEFFYANNLQHENEQELKDVYNAIVFLEQSIGRSRVGLMSMYTAIKQLPRMEKDMNKAIRITENHLEVMLHELDEYRKKTREFKDYMELNLKEK